MQLGRWDAAYCVSRLNEKAELGELIVLIGAIPLCVRYQQSVLFRLNTTSVHIIIDSLVLATCFGFYRPSSGLCLLYVGTFSVHIHYGIP